jgi:hypothetical protein
VIARVLGMPVPTVTVRSAAPMAVSASAAYHADNSDVAARIAGFETDAKIALAGRVANHREVPDIPILDHEDEDCARAASMVYKAECLKRGEVRFSAAHRAAGGLR